MLRIPPASATGRREYATPADFQQIFTDEMNRLYLLSFLLTVDQKKAEQCFVCGVADCVKAKTVLKDWAPSWARHTILQNAIRMIAPAPNRRTNLSQDSGGRDSLQSTPEMYRSFGAVIQLDGFERFVFVMSVLERYSVQECSVLLGCSRAEVVAGRLRAVQQMGTFAVSSAAMGKEPYSDDSAYRVAYR